MSDTATTKEILRRALQDAVSWQVSLSNTYPNGSAEWIEARKQAGFYRKILERRYGTSKTRLDQLLEGAKLVPIQQIGKR